MDTNTTSKATIKKETKHKIVADFDRTPLKERLKAKFLNLYFFQQVVWYIFRLVLLIGISYVVLYPFFTKIAGSFMSPEDFVDVTVRLIPKNFTMEIYKAVLTELNYGECILNTFLLSLSCGILQTFVCCLIGYGLAKFKFSGNKLVMMLVILTMIVPHNTLQLGLFQQFRYFDIWGILSLLSGHAKTGFSFLDTWLAEIHVLNIDTASFSLINTYVPLLSLSATGLAFKNGLYIFLLRQFFIGVPDALEESAYIDGSGPYKTFITIILPLSVPMMVTVFLFAFCWQWTDQFYTNLFFSGQNVTLLSKFGSSDLPTSLKSVADVLPGEVSNLYEKAVTNTCGLCIIVPLVILYAFCQNFLVQGIERSGLTAE